MIKIRNTYGLFSEEELSKRKFSHCQACLFYDNAFDIPKTEAKDYNNAPRNESSIQDGKMIQVVRATKIIQKEEALCGSCELIDEYSFFRNNHPDSESLSYNPRELESYCSLVRSMVQIECSRERVSTGIGEHYKINTIRDYKLGGHKIEETSDKQGVDRTINRWEPSQPVFISAQTGQGKNYFIENELIPYVKKLNQEKVTKQKVLIISNRKALQKQIKNRIDGNDDYGNEENSVYPYKEFADCITYQGLLNRVDFFKRVQKNRNSSYIYVICDEAHFFTSDAMFNPHTEKILSAIVSTFKDAIRVYMSATPYECFEYIHKQEAIKPSYYSFAFYHFKRDYSYLCTEYYSDIDELRDLIVKSVNEKREKWLVFIDDIDECENSKKKLIEYGDSINSPMQIEVETSNEHDNLDESDKPEKKKIDKVLAVNAKSKNNDIYKIMVVKETLDKNTYVLISTSVLDNGVNLRGINNIVVSDSSKVKVLQMLGRARVEYDKNLRPLETKTLYIKRFNEDYMNKRIQGLNKQKDAYHSYNLAYEGLDNQGNAEYNFLNKYYNDKESDWINAKHWFGRPLKEPTKLYPNIIALSLVDTLLPTYEAILEEMNTEKERATSKEKNDEKRVVGQHYLEYQLNWFGKQYEEESDITFKDHDLNMKKFIEFLESHVTNDIEIHKEDKESFQIEFTRLHKQIFSVPESVKKNPNKYPKGYGLKMINTELEKHNIPYKIESDNKTSIWKVIRL